VATDVPQLKEMERYDLKSYFESAQNKITNTFLIVKIKIKGTSILYGFKRIVNILS